MITMVRKDVSIWNINSFAEYYLQIFGKYESNYSTACYKFIAERNRFMEHLKEISFYVLFHLLLIIFMRNHE